MTSFSISYIYIPELLRWIYFLIELSIYVEVCMCVCVGGGVLGASDTLNEWLMIYWDNTCIIQQSRQLFLQD